MVEGHVEVVGGAGRRLGDVVDLARGAWRTKCGNPVCIPNLELHVTEATLHFVESQISELEDWTA